MENLHSLFQLYLTIQTDLRLAGVFVFFPMTLPFNTHH